MMPVSLIVVAFLSAQQSLGSALPEYNQ